MACLKSKTSYLNFTTCYLCEITRFVFFLGMVSDNLTNFEKNISELVECLGSLTENHQEFMTISSWAHVMVHAPAQSQPSPTQPSPVQPGGLREALRINHDQVFMFLEESYVLGLMIL